MCLPYIGTCACCDAYLDAAVLNAAAASEPVTGARPSMLNNKQAFVLQA